MAKHECAAGFVATLLEKITTFPNLELSQIFDRTEKTFTKISTFILLATAFEINYNEIVSKIVSMFQHQ